MSRTKPSAPAHGPVFRDASGESFGDRLRYLKARSAMLSKSRALSNREIALKVSQRLHETPPYTGASVSGWMRDKWPVSIIVVAAVAEVFHCDPGWLAFGAASQALSPEEAARQADQRDIIARVADVMKREATRAPDYTERPVIRPGRRPREA